MNYSADGEGRKSTPAESAFWILNKISEIQKLDFDPLLLPHSFVSISASPDPDEMSKAAAVVGMKARVVDKATLKFLGGLDGPVALYLRDGRYAILKMNPGGQMAIVGRAFPVPQPVNNAFLNGIWSGKALIFQPPTILQDSSDAEVSEIDEFGFNWFLKAVKTQSGAISQILLASAFIQILALASPLLFQVVIDKVLTNRSIATLHIVAIAMLIIIISDGILQLARTRILNVASNHIDARLGVDMFGHLISLPLSYFEQRATGITAARLREIETVRRFLTGQVLTSVLDFGFTLLYVIVLALYSWKLTLVSISMFPVYIASALLLRPMIRKQTNSKFAKNAQQQQFLVETISGIATVKSMAAEFPTRREWKERLIGYLGTSFSLQMTVSRGQSIVTVASRLSSLMILLVGATLVMDGDLTVGELIAFNMIAAQMTAPILRLSGLWQDMQQVAVSVDRIRDVFSTETEINKDKRVETYSKQINGSICFSNVSFYYPKRVTPALELINLDIPSGAVVGIVGASGSGKSTVARLIQRIEAPTTGSITIDGISIKDIDLRILRQQIGVVLQDSLLFSRSVKDNIAFGRRDATEEHVIASAKLAGAHDFILALPQGYETRIQERGLNLSGGQRQRIAIARALASRPRILIFDEATSALDYESESAIQANMARIVKGRTVIIIAHRLSSVRKCDMIVGMEDGRVVETGTHEQLLAANSKVYARLWQLQSGLAGA